MISVNDQGQCQSLCALDTGCKGFVMLLSINFNNQFVNQCQLATTSTCPSNSFPVFVSSSVLDLDPNASCGYQPPPTGPLNLVHNGGCYIKQGQGFH